MTSLGRGFVAVVPPDDVLDAIEVRVASVRAEHEHLRWSRREQWHVTLRFLGAVPDVDALLAVLHASVAAVPGVDALTLGGAGAFPTVRRASIIWFGAREGAGALARIATAVETAAVAAGFTPEPRDFRAHLTVARVPRPRDVANVLAALGDEPVGPAWPVADVVFVSSDTRATGAVYSEVARIPLARMGA